MSLRDMLQTHCGILNHNVKSQKKINYFIAKVIKLACNDFKIWLEKD